jgi:Uma2 family endonuclease
MGAAALRVEDLPHYTYDDYVQWEGKWELIHGIPYAMTPAPVIIHQKIGGKIFWQLTNLLLDCKKCEALMPVDWPVTEDTVIQPDVLVVCGDADKIGVKKLEVTPVIVFEVLSPSTSRKDRIIKYRLYEDAGVKYYCIADPETKSSTVFSLQNSKEKYLEEGDFKEGKMFFDLGPCRIEFDFGRIFDK